MIRRFAAALTVVLGLLLLIAQVQLVEERQLVEEQRAANAAAYWRK